MLLHNVLARWRHRMPVRSVALLLRPARQEGLKTTSEFHRDPPLKK